MFSWMFFWFILGKRTDVPEEKTEKEWEEEEEEREEEEEEQEEEIRIGRETTRLIDWPNLNYCVLIKLTYYQEYSININYS